MKIKYPFLSGIYLVNAHKIFNEQENSSTVNLEMLIEAQSPSLFSNKQNLYITRKIIPNERENQSLQRFVFDSGKILENIHLQLNSDRRPIKIFNQKQIVKSWMELIENLHSKYSGDWEKKQLNIITMRLADENELLQAVRMDFPINELFERDLYQIDFDNNWCKKRTHIENTLGVPLIFNQICERKLEENTENICIQGEADLKLNQSTLRSFCSKQSFELNDIESITQKNIYTKRNSQDLFDEVKSKFQIHGKNGCLKEVKVILNIQKMNQN